MVLALFTRLFTWDQGMAPEPGEQYWLGKNKERTPDRCGNARPSPRSVRSPAGLRSRWSLMLTPDDEVAAPNLRPSTPVRPRGSRSGGCKYYCDRQNIRHGFTTMEGGLSRPGHPHWDGSQGHYSVYN